MGETWKNKKIYFIKDNRKIFPKRYFTYRDGGEHKMSKLMKVWTWFNGKKTTFGALVLFLIYVAKGVETYFGVVVIPQAVLDQISNYAMWFTGLGLAHKAVKKAV